MSSTNVETEGSAEAPEPGTIDMKLEVINLPVSDVDRAKGFYQKPLRESAVPQRRDRSTRAGPGPRRSLLLHMGVVH
jgi:hypothetical protein